MTTLRAILTEGDRWIAPLAIVSSLLIILGHRRGIKWLDAVGVAGAWVGVAMYVLGHML
jgi:hypothetical protein